jgi:hypothetical protein
MPRAPELAQCCSCPVKADTCRPFAAIQHDSDIASRKTFDAAEQQDFAMRQRQCGQGVFQLAAPFFRRESIERQRPIVGENGIGIDLSFIMLPAVPVDRQVPPHPVKPRQELPLVVISLRTTQ